MAENKLLYLSQADVVAVGLSMNDIIDAVETAFRAKGEGRTEMPPKPGVHPGGGNNFIHAMPAYIPALHSIGMKWVSGYPTNIPKQGLPYITGLLILNDEATGLPLSVMDCTWITAKRTGAASALSAKYLARPESSTLGVLGCGVQGRSNLEAFKVLFPLTHVIAYDVLPGHGRAVGRIRRILSVEVRSSRRRREAVTGCDIVATAGPILGAPRDDPAGLARQGRLRLSRGLRLLLDAGGARPRRPSSARTTCRSCASTSPWATSRTSRRSTPTWASSSSARRRAARTRASG